MQVPHLYIRNFAGVGFCSALLSEALGQRPEFSSSMIGLGIDAKIDLQIRKSLKLSSRGPVAENFKSKLSNCIPEWAATLGFNTVDSRDLETEIVAHGDGAYYRRHIDTGIRGVSETSRKRVLSIVYYFSHNPTPFSGGELRLLLPDFGLTSEPPILDLIPEPDSIAVFPSWLEHEVCEVHCPTGSFEDSRFSFNCWVYNKPKQ